MENHGRDFLRSIVASVDSHARHTAFIDDIVGHTLDFLLHLSPVFSHESLDGVNGLLGVRDGLTLGRVAHLALAIARESYYGRRGALALAIGDDDGLVALENRNTRVGSS